MGSIKFVMVSLCIPAFWIGWCKAKYTGGWRETEISDGHYTPFSFPEGTTKIGDLSPNSESVSDESQAALAVSALSLVCFGEEDVVFFLGYIQGFNFYTETKADRNLKKEEWFKCYKYLQENNQLSGVDVFTVSRDSDKKDVVLKVSAWSGHSQYKTLWK